MILAILRRREGRFDLQLKSRRLPVVEPILGHFTYEKRRGWESNPRSIVAIPELVANRWNPKSVQADF